MTFPRILELVIGPLLIAAGLTGLLVSSTLGYSLLIGSAYALGWLKGRKHTVDALGNLMEAGRRAEAEARRLEQAEADYQALLERTRKLR